jgi:hypothetical protein
MFLCHGGTLVKTPLGETVQSVQNGQELIKMGSHHGRNG